MPPTTALAHRLATASKRFGPLALVLALAVAGGLLSWRYLVLREQEIRQTLTGEARKGLIDIAVSQQPLPAGTVLEEDMLVRRAVPAEFVHPDALTPDSAAGFVGQTLTVEAEPGKPLLASFFSRPEPVFAEQIEPGVRAVTLPVDEISSISGLLRAGDHVDFMYVADEDAPGSGGRDKSVVPLLQDVEVRATGQVTAQAFAALRRRGPEAEQDSSRQPGYTTVTVALAPRQAQLLILAQRLGSLHAVLRNPQDRQTPPRGLTTDDLARYVREASGRPQTQPQPARPVATTARVRAPAIGGDGVEFIVGGTGASAPVETPGSALRRLLGAGSPGGLPQGAVPAASAPLLAPATSDSAAAPAPSSADGAGTGATRAWPGAWSRSERPADAGHPAAKATVPTPGRP